jgi:hypothetical protein
VQHDHAVGAAVTAVPHLDLDGVETVRYRHCALCRRPRTSSAFPVARGNREMSARLDRFAAVVNAAQGLPGAPAQQARSQFTDPARNF